MINLLQKYQDNQVVIQSRNKNFVGPESKTVTIPCRGEMLPILVVADEINYIKGLIAEEALVTVKKDRKSKLSCLSPIQPNNTFLYPRSNYWDNCS